MRNVSVVVVSFNTSDLLRRCLTSLVGLHEVIVVDNASSDGSPDIIEREFPGVKLIRNSENRGFGAANNQGIEIATGELVLLLNSDASAGPGAMGRLSSVFDDSSVVAAGGRLVNPDGSLQESCANQLTLWAVFCEQSYLEKLFPSSRFLSPYWMSSRIGQTMEVAQVMGACLMMRPLERFDERIFLYCEDTELCLRLKTHGKILYVPEATFVHELGASSSGSRWLSVARYNRGKELYFRIHSGAWASFVCWLLDRAGALLRTCIWLCATILTLGLVRRFRVRVALFFRVLLAPLSGPPSG